MQGQIVSKKRTFSSVMRNFVDTDEFSALIPLVILLAGVGLANKQYLSLANISSIMNLVPFIGICCLGNALVIMTGSADISVGRTAGLACMVFGYAIKVFLLPAWVAIIMAILVGGLVGLINAMIIFDLNLPSFIVTLGMSYVIGSCRFFLSKGYPYTELGEGVKAFGKAVIPGLGVNYPFIIFVVMYVFVGIMLAKTTFGHQIKAVGDNSEVAQLSGINVKSIKKFAYIACGLIVAVAGLLTAIRLDYAAPATGSGWEFKCMAACAIGGVSLSGGKGSGICIAIGITTMMLLDNAIVMLGIPTHLQTTAIGAFLMLAASLDMYKTKKKIRGDKEVAVVE